MNRNSLLCRTGLALVSGIAIVACVERGESRSAQQAALHEAACISSDQTESPWHIANLYDCDTRSLFIPWQLWTGADWTGDKSAACMHVANSRFAVNENSWTTIKGPLVYQHPSEKKAMDVWHRSKTDGSKVQYFSCHAQGIGRLFDSRRSRVYASGRCKFPAGQGWQLHRRRECNDTAIEIVQVELNARDEVSALKFKWWVRGELDHIYRYVPNYGMTNAWQQR